MNKRFFKSISSAIPLALGLTCSMTAGHCHTDLNARISQLENNMQKVRGETAMGNFGAKTASGFPQIDGYGIFVTGEFLWWKLYEFQTDYVFTNKPSTTQNKGHVDDMRFKWEPGFRLGLGYIFDYDGWDINCDFTDYATHAHHKSKAHTGGTLHPQWGFDMLASTIDARWKVQFYEIELALGRNYFVSRFLSLHPFFGLSTAWIQQHRSLRIAAGTGPVKLQGKNNFWGIGPELGLDTQFFLGRNFSIYGNVSGALLWGHFHVKEKEYSKTSPISYYNERFNTKRMAPTVDFGIGLAYETNFNNNCNHFMAKIGYESQYWWKQNQFFNINFDSFSQKQLSDDLGMQGLTIDLRLDF